VRERLELPAGRDAELAFRPYGLCKRHLQSIFAQMAAAATTPLPLPTPPPKRRRFAIVAL